MQYQSECLSALKSVANEILMYGGNFVIKGDGADKTFLEMETPNLPKKKSDMYSSPVMINIKHNLWLGAEYEVTGNAEKGAFKVKVAGASNFKVGEWVCLYLHDNNPELVRRELLPYTWESTMTNISTEGVQVEDYHQIVSEAASIISSANFSAYKINITGNRGHSAFVPKVPAGCLLVQYVIVRTDRWQTNTLRFRLMPDNIMLVAYRNLVWELLFGG